MAEHNQQPQPQASTVIHRWAMVVDLDLCTGCQACVVACHAENNVPFVGEVEVIKGRSMHWIRIERYWLGGHGEPEGALPGGAEAGTTGSVATAAAGPAVAEPIAQSAPAGGFGKDALRAFFLPMLCQHCQNAPCEPVCPMYAIYHSTEDNTNNQVYNRCIGTRLCALNCPWKVRVFNWFDPHIPNPLNEQLNPDVTARRRGLVEKCTYCIQRIRRARWKSEADAVPIKDGDVVPACAQTCPTDALVFGDLNDPNSRAARLMGSNRAYKILEYLGTHPSGTYLKRGESHVI